jgi:RimJ/RimL family protein N-acetyltransferase
VDKVDSMLDAAPHGAATLPNGRRIEMRPATAEDAPALRAHYHAMARGENPWYPFPLAGGSLDLWMERGGYLDFARNLHWLVTADGGVAAHLFFQRADIPSIGLEGIAMVFFTIAPELRGRGVGDAVVADWRARVVPWLRASGVRRAAAHIFSENLASARLALGMGFRWEGTLRQHMRARDGRFHDVQVFAFLVSEDPPCTTCGRAEARLRRTLGERTPHEGSTS